MNSRQIILPIVPEKGKPHESAGRKAAGLGLGFEIWLQSCRADEALSMG